MAWCPECGGEMKATEALCPHCGYDFPATPRPRANMFKSRFFWLVILILPLFYYDFLVRALLLPRKVHSDWVEDMPLRSHEVAAEYNGRLFRLYSCYTAGKGEYGLRRRFADAGGTVCAMWILVEQGRITVVDDHSRVLREFPGIRTFCPDALRIGYWTQSALRSGREFAEDESGSSATGTLYVISFDEQGAGERYFY